MLFKFTSLFIYDTDHFPLLRLFKLLPSINVLTNRNVNFIYPILKILFSKINAADVRKHILINYKFILPTKTSGFIKTTKAIFCSFSSKPYQQQQQLSLRPGALGFKLFIKYFNM